MEEAVPAGDQNAAGACEVNVPVTAGSVQENTREGMHPSSQKSPVLTAASADDAGDGVLPSPVGSPCDSFDATWRGYVGIDADQMLELVKHYGSHELCITALDFYETTCVNSLDMFQAKGAVDAVFTPTGPVVRR